MGGDFLRADHSAMDVRFKDMRSFDAQLWLAFFDIVATCAYEQYLVQLV